MQQIAARIGRRLRNLAFPEDSFLKKVSGVIHVGANTGQERNHYASLGLNVVWVEPIPTVFEKLQKNIADLAEQRAYCRLISDQHGREYTFHISDNGGESSSIFAFGKHPEIWPEVNYTHDIHLSATTLNSTGCR
jgi:FkbM family methyltransferase